MIKGHPEEVGVFDLDGCAVLHMSEISQPCMRNRGSLAAGGCQENRLVGATVSRAAVNSTCNIQRIKPVLVCLICVCLN